MRGRCWALVSVFFLCPTLRDSFHQWHRHLASAHTASFWEWLPTRGPIHGSVGRLGFSPGPIQIPAFTEKVFSNERLQIVVGRFVKKAD